jgi:anti-sigma regulatory factor (Ser/Thr protein kinase)
VLWQLRLVGVQPAALPGIAQQSDEVSLLLFVHAVEIEQGAESPGLRPHAGVLNPVERGRVDSGALEALPTAPACARGHVRAVACLWGLADLAATAELVTSELVTNATQASDRLRVRADLPIVPVVRLWLASDRISLVIRVWDADDEMPVRRDARPDDMGGRGLMIIDSLAKDWGSYREASGKVVWAVVAREALRGAGDE